MGRLGIRCACACVARFGLWVHPYLTSFQLFVYYRYHCYAYAHHFCRGPHYGLWLLLLSTRRVKKKNTKEYTIFVIAAFFHTIFFLSVCHYISLWDFVCVALLNADCEREEESSHTEPAVHSIQSHSVMFIFKLIRFPRTHAARVISDSGCLYISTYIPDWVRSLLNMCRYCEHKIPCCGTNVVVDDDNGNGNGNDISHNGLVGFRNRAYMRDLNWF